MDEGVFMVNPEGANPSVGGHEPKETTSQAGAIERDEYYENMQDGKEIEIFHTIWDGDLEKAEKMMVSAGTDKGKMQVIARGLALDFFRSGHKGGDYLGLKEALDYFGVEISGELRAEIVSSYYERDSYFPEDSDKIKMIFELTKQETEEEDDDYDPDLERAKALNNAQTITKEEYYEG